MLTEGDRVRHINPACILHTCHGTVTRDAAPALFQIPGTVLVKWDEASSPTFDAGSSRSGKASLDLGCDRYPVGVLEKIPSGQRSVCVVAAQPLSRETIDKSLLDAGVTARELVVFPDLACSDSASEWAKMMHVPTVRLDAVGLVIDHLLAPTNTWKGAIVAVKGGECAIAKRLVGAALGRNLDVLYPE